MPDLTATSTGFDDGYTARFENGYNEEEIKRKDTRG